MWSTRVDSFTDLATVTEKLMADAAELEMLESMNGLFMAPAEDRLSQFVTAPLEAPRSGTTASPRQR